MAKQTNSEKKLSELYQIAKKGGKNAEDMLYYFLSMSSKALINRVHDASVNWKY